MATTNTVPTAANVLQYRGVAELSDSKWRSFIINRERCEYTIGEFQTAEAATLAHDRAILAILGPDASAEVFNFRAAFSDTELRFLRGRHAPARHVAGVIAMIRMGNYDAELARFAEHTFDAYMDPELVQDVASFRFAHDDALRQRKEAALATLAATGANVDPVARTKAERDVEREAFLEATKNKATDEAWVKSYRRRRQQSGMMFEDENRWPLVVPTADINVGDWFPGEELIYLPHGSSYVDEMMVGNDLIKREPHA